jgi:hypothetical protein
MEQNVNIDSKPRYSPEFKLKGIYQKTSLSSSHSFFKREFFSAPLPAYPRLRVLGPPWLPPKDKIPSTLIRGW